MELALKCNRLRGVETMDSRLILWAGMIGILIMGVACGALTEPDPPTQELLLSLEPLPRSWEISGSPRPMGPDIGFGDKDDHYVNFKLKSSKYIISSHFVLFYPNARKAGTGYLEMSRSEFNDNSIAVDKPWETPPELSYASSHADQFRAACTINNVAGPKQVCEIMGQYGQYVTIFHSVIGPDTMSLNEFNDVIRFLDEKMVRELKLDQAE